MTEQTTTGSDRYYVTQEIVRDRRGRVVFRPWTVFDTVQVVPGFPNREKSFGREDEARTLCQQLNARQPS